MSPSLETILTPPDLAVKGSELNEEQKKAVAEVAAHFNKDGYTAPDGENKDTRSPLILREYMFFSESRIAGYYTVHQTVEKTIEAIEKTIAWRRDRNMYDVDAFAKEVEDEFRNGFAHFLGFDPEGRPIVYFFPNKDITPAAERRTLPSAFIMDRAGDMCLGDVNTVVIIQNFGGKRQGDLPTISSATEQLSNLETHAPEVLYKLHFQQIGWMLRGFFALLNPVMPARTASRILKQDTPQSIKDGYFTGDELIKEVGGNLDWTYKHDEYFWPMVEHVKKYRAEQEKRFEALGKPEFGRDERLFRVAPVVHADSDLAGVLHIAIRGD